MTLQSKEIRKIYLQGAGELAESLQSTDQGEGLTQVSNSVQEFFVFVKDVIPDVVLIIATLTISGAATTDAWLSGPQLGGGEGGGACLARWHIYIYNVYYTYTIIHIQCILYIYIYTTCCLARWRAALLQTRQVLIMEME